MANHQLSLFLPSATAEDRFAGDCLPALAGVKDQQGNFVRLAVVPTGTQKRATADYAARLRKAIAASSRGEGRLIRASAVVEIGAVDLDDATITITPAGGKLLRPLLIDPPAPRFDYLQRRRPERPGQGGSSRWQKRSSHTSDC